MERITIKGYATHNKLSIFNVVKMIKSGVLKSEVVDEDGKEVTYILEERKDGFPKSMKPSENTKKDPSLLKKLERLEQDVTILKRELDALKMSVGIRS